MKKTLLLTLALAAALAHSETFNAPHTDGDKKVVLGGAGVALTPEVAQLHEQAVAALFSGQARAAIPLLDKAIARYEKQFAADPRQRYAASGNVETLFYLTKAANEGKEAYIIDPRWAELYYLRRLCAQRTGRTGGGQGGSGRAACLAACKRAGAERARLLLPARKKLAGGGRRFRAGDRIQPMD